MAQIPIILAGVWIQMSAMDYHGLLGPGPGIRVITTVTHVFKSRLVTAAVECHPVMNERGGGILEAIKQCGWTVLLLGVVLRHAFHS